MPFAVLDPSTAAAAPTTTAGNPLTSVGETLSTLRTELDLQLGDRSDITNARLDSWINWAYRNVAAMLDIKELYGSVSFALVASPAQPFYSIPVQVAWIKRLSVIDASTYPVDEGRELAMIDEAEYRKLRVLVDEPTAYFRWRRMVVIWPTPEVVRTCALDFKVRPNDLVATTDSPILPVEFHEPILLSARHRGLRSLMNWKDALPAMNDFLAAIRPLLNTDAAETMGQNAQLIPVRKRADLFRSEG